MIGGKSILGPISIFLVVVVGVCIALMGGDASKDTFDTGKIVLHTTSKAVATVCESTQFKESCVGTMNKVQAKNESATPTDYLKAAINVILEEVEGFLNNSGSIFGDKVSNPTVKMAKNDCDDLLQYAIQELQASFSMVGDSELHTLSQREAELKNWLSAVISYHESCVDQIPKGQPELQKQLADGLLNASQLTSNALAMVDSISSILHVFNVDLKIGEITPPRQVSDEHKSDGGNAYPHWVTSNDRKLLGSDSNAQVKPNVVVAKDGSGQFKTIGEALKAYPKNLQGRFVIYVKAGVYDEIVMIPKNMVNVFMYGDGPRKTIVTGKRSVVAGYTTSESATFAAIGDGFMAKSMGFTNTAGPKGEQAVALRVISDRALFYNCRMDGFQDTLYVQAHRQFYRNCVISGTVDFIFGDSATVIQNCLIIVRKPDDDQKNAVTAHGRQYENEVTGLVIQNCRIVPDQALFPVRFKIPSYLGRPWKQYSRTVIMETTIGDFIRPEGWMPWAGTFALDTLYYAEYANRGPAAATDQRVKWKGYQGVIDRATAEKFTSGPFLQGNTWLGESGIPYLLGFRR
ncbi:hypothetical protein SLE2022_093020 [Rubroshorea leprosula]